MGDQRQQARAYLKKRLAAGAISRSIALAGRNIGKLPRVKRRALKRLCRSNLRLFCETYLPERFNRPWSPDHLKFLAKLQGVILAGGLFCLAMPRGSGKTAICEAACIWAILYGHREFVVLVGATEDKARQILGRIEGVLENNDRLLGDFPEAVFPIRALERIHQRASGQLYRKRPTAMTWTADTLVMPTIRHSRASGGIIKVCGITGDIRGLQHQRQDGRVVRPDLVLIDDPQTDESAKSPAQSSAREKIVSGAILGLAGVGVKIAAMMTVTVIAQGDLADRMLSRDLHPEWQGERFKMVYEWPKREDLWEEYAEVRADGLRNDRGMADASEFYREHREDMDAGSRVAWESCFDEDELSAIQHAWNLRLRDESAFLSEYQNEPEQVSEKTELTAEGVMKKATGLARGVAPGSCEFLTAFIDPNTVFFWAVAAWKKNFTGQIIDYGAWPEQGRAVWTMAGSGRTIFTAAKTKETLEAVWRGLDETAEALCSREFKREDGSIMRLSVVLVDAGWGEATDTIYEWCRRSKWANMVRPSHGRYVGAAKLPFGEWRSSKGDVCGLNWRSPVPKAPRYIRHVAFDANWWKSFVTKRLSLARAARGELSLFGKPADHRLYADHLTAEYPVRTMGQGRTVDEWQLKSSKPDNHWFDCTVGVAVGASVLGATPSLDELLAPQTKARKKRVSYI